MRCLAKQCSMPGHSATPMARSMARVFQCWLGRLSDQCHEQQDPGICENVPVNIGGIIVNIHFFVSENPSQEIVLGQAALRQTEASMDYYKDGLVVLTMKKDGIVATLVVNKSGNSRYLRLVPGQSRATTPTKRFNDEDQTQESDDEDKDLNSRMCNQASNFRGQGIHH